MLNQGLLMSAEEKALQNPHHTQVGCSSCEDVVQADALYPQEEFGSAISRSWETAIFLRL